MVDHIVLHRGDIGREKANLSGAGILAGSLAGKENDFKGDKFGITIGGGELGEIGFGGEVDVDEMDVAFPIVELELERQSHTRSKIPRFVVEARADR